MTTQKFSHEQISQKQATAAKIALGEQETEAKKAALEKEEAMRSTQQDAKKIQLEEQAVMAQSHGDKTDPKYIAYLNQQKLLLAEIAELQKKLGQDTQTASQQGALVIKKEQDSLTQLQQATEEGTG